MHRQWKGSTPRRTNMVSIFDFVAVTAAVALLAGGATAHHDAAAHFRYHRLEKGKAARQPHHNVFRLQRRESACALSTYTLCDVSIGGCCPNHYDCQSSSCIVATDGPSNGCAYSNYYSCPIEKGIGCCPIGTVCDDDGGCSQPDGTPNEGVQCPSNYFSCPASLGGGCCKNGMGCAAQSCYATGDSTASVSYVTTTTDDSGSEITTTVHTKTTISGSSGSGSASAGGQAKYVPSTVSKMETIQTGEADSSDNNDGGGGLSKGEIAGIVVGVAAVLLAIITASFIIIRKLKQTEAAVRQAGTQQSSSAGNRSNGQQRRSQKTGFSNPQVSEIGSYDADPLMRRPSHARAGSDSLVVGIGGTTPPNLPPRQDNSRSAPPAPWPGHYDPVPLSEAPDSRNQSMDSPRLYGWHRSSHDSSGGYMQHTHHNRHGSNASEVSGSADGQHGVSELEQHGYEGRRRSSSGATATRPSLAHVRQGSDGRQRSDSAALDTVNEINELHGYYGPPDRSAGQTAAMLRRASSVSITPIEAYQRPPKD